MKTKPNTNIPMFTRMGGRVEQILHYDTETKVIRFIHEGGDERAYHAREFVHHDGSKGVAAHILASGCKIK